MLEQLSVRNFTIFKDIIMDFSPGLTIITGDSNSGKTTFLKLAYLITNAEFGLYKAGKTQTELYIEDRLKNIFSVHSLADLHNKSAVDNLEVSAHTTTQKWNFYASKKICNSINAAAITYPKEKPSKALYLHDREMVSFYKGFISAYIHRELSFDETFYDLAISLSQAKLKRISLFSLFDTNDLAYHIDGKLILRDGQFYLQRKTDNIEISLVANSFRMVAMVLYLLDIEAISIGDTLFWDMPELTIPKKYLEAIATILVNLTTIGIQVVLTTQNQNFSCLLDQINTKQGRYKCFSKRIYLS